MKTTEKPRTVSIRMNREMTLTPTGLGLLNWTTDTNDDGIRIDTLTLTSEYPDYAFRGGPAKLVLIDNKAGAEGLFCYLAARYGVGCKENIYPELIYHLGFMVF